MSDHPLLVALLVAAVVTLAVAGAFLQLARGKGPDLLSRRPRGSG